MGTGIPGDKDFSIEGFKKSIQLGAKVISVGVALYDDQVIVRPENYDLVDNKSSFLNLESIIAEFPGMLHIRDTELG